jgi:transcriptional regulator with XRE-family HTH domain
MMETDRAVPDGGVNARIARRLRALRHARGLSLDALAAVCGVSRSALSLIERAESSPTAVVLDRIAAGLGVPLETLFGGTEPAAGPLARRGDQPVWRDPSSGYLRRSVSPTVEGSPVRIVEIDLPAGARVAFEGVPGRAVHQQLWLLEGTIVVGTGDESYELAAGDCLVTRLDRPAMFRNPARTRARYATVTLAEPA